VALSKGCNDFLRKPFHEADIFDLMQRHLGVQFVYEDGVEQMVKDEGQKAEEILTLDALAALPIKWLENLKFGAYRADFLLLSKVIEQIREKDAKLADALSPLVEDFEYDKILALIK